MPLYICRWQNGDFSAVSAASKTDVIELLDEVGNAEVCELFTVKKIMVHFSLKQSRMSWTILFPLNWRGLARRPWTP